MLRIENLEKNYNCFHLNCSLEVLPGCVTGLIGRNGAGKSTTFKAALGLISPDGGKVEVFGKDVKKLSRADKQKIGVVLSASGFSGYLTVKDVMAILENMYDAFDKALFLELCRRLELPMEKQIKEFSTGMRAKAKLTAALTHGADLLILDEPTVGLDVIAREELLELLREYMEGDENHAILISSHISSDLEGLCDDFYMIHEGKVLLHEEMDVLLGDYGVLKADPGQWERLEKQYILNWKKEPYGYSCLTNQRQFYAENYPGLTVERGTMDELITMMIRGERL